MNVTKGKYENSFSKIIYGNKSIREKFYWTMAFDKEECQNIRWSLIFYSHDKELKKIIFYKDVPLNMYIANALNELQSQSVPNVLTQMAVCL